MRSLPVADPGTPDHRSPGRFLWWLARQQLPTLAGGMAFGIVAAGGSYAALWESWHGKN